MCQIIVQHAVDKKLTPSVSRLKKWAKVPLTLHKKEVELTIRIVDEKEITMLNLQYRHKNKPTNVLSFPFDMPDVISDEIFILGDIVICAEVVNSQAKIAGKKNDAHWAHMVIHGTLHLLGYDHERDADAEKMEQQEISILKSLGFPNPYV